MPLQPPGSQVSGLGLGGALRCPGSGAGPAVASLSLRLQTAQWWVHSVSRTQAASSLGSPAHTTLLRGSESEVSHVAAIQMNPSSTFHRSFVWNAEFGALSGPYCEV